MTNRRAKAVATATVLGLGALGGVALGSNPGMPSAAQQASGGATASVLTSASGTAAVPTSQTVAIKSVASGRAPIVTRASGGGLTSVPRDD
jgi:hypothetical protein